MATLIGYTVRVEALPGRDLDQQSCALELLPRVLEVEFFGVPGGGSYFQVMFSGEPPRPIEAMLARCDSVIRRAKSGDWVNSEVMAGAARSAFAHLGGYFEAGKL